MKRILSFVLILAVFLLSAGSVSAQGDTVTPIFANTEADTSYGVYLADIPDTSAILSSGTFTASLYAQDMYRLEDIHGLKPGSTIRIDGRVFTVSSVETQADGSIRIVPEESFDGTLLFLENGEVYTALVNGYAAASYVTDYTFMMPLPDAFRFCWVEASGTVQFYNQDAFSNMVTKVSAPALTRSRVVVSFRNGNVQRIIYTENLVRDPVENAVRPVALAESPSSGTSGSSSPAPVYSGSSGAGSFSLQPIVWDGAGIGKAGVPAGYSLLTPEVNCCDSETCVGAPIRLRLVCDSDTTPVRFVFYATQAFIERVKTGYWRQKDWSRDGQMNIFMLRYHNAEQYSDLLASQLVTNPVFYRNEDTSFYNSVLAEHLREYQNEVTEGLTRLGEQMNWTEVTAAHRTYTFDHNGTTYALCIMTEVRAYQSKAGAEVATVWFVPAYYFMTCPLSMYEQVHGNEFKIFLENTAVSDTFINLSEKLTAQLAQQIKNKWASDIAASNAYVAAMNAFMERSVNDYLYSSNYSASDRFSDYIFDRNEYTTSDGYSVSISTSYDYVWEGSGGTVYYSNSALDVPYGATMLSPSR